MKFLITIVLLAAVSGSGFSQPELKIYGSLGKIMHENDTSEKVRLNLMGPIYNHYGLGAVAGLDGEILILKGETYVTRVFNGSLATDKSTDVGAALLVLTQVDEWDTLNLEIDISSMNELGGYIEEQDYEGVFPFMVLTNEGTLEWHVIQSPDNDEEMKNHKNSALKGKYKGEALILGFFSQSHQGVFTHHDENTHMHFQSSDKLYSGHVDELHISKNDKLLIPKYLQK